MPRIAEGKYLEPPCAMHQQMGTLDIKEVSKLCPRCDLKLVPREAEAHSPLPRRSLPKKEHLMPQSLSLLLEELQIWHQAYDELVLRLGN
jgi:hypothetical protein